MHKPGHSSTPILRKGRVPSDVHYGTGFDVEKISKEERPSIGSELDLSIETLAVDRSDDVNDVTSSPVGSVANTENNTTIDSTPNQNTAVSSFIENSEEVSTDIANFTPGFYYNSFGDTDAVTPGSLPQTPVSTTAVLVEMKSRILELENDNLELRKTTQSVDLSPLQRQLISLKEENETLQGGARLAATETSDLRIREQQLEYDYEKLKLKLSDLQAIEREGSQAARQIGELAAENETLQKQVFRSETEVDETRSLLEDQHALTNRISQLMNVKIELQQKITEAEEKDRERGQNQHILMSRVTDLICENDNLCKKIESLESQQTNSTTSDTALDSLHKKLEILSEMTATNELLKSDKTNLESKVSILQQEIINLEQQLQTTQHSQTDNSIESFIATADLKDSEIAAGKEEISCLLRELQNAQSDKSDCEAQMASLQAELDSKNTTITSLQQDVTSNKDDVTTLRRELELVKQEKNTIAIQLQDSERELNTDAEQLEDLQHQLTTQQTSYKTLQDKLEIMALDNAAKAGQVNVLRKQISEGVESNKISVEREMSEMKSESEQLSSELDVYKNKNIILTQQLDSLKQQLSDETQSDQEDVANQLSLYRQKNTSVIDSLSQEVTSLQETNQNFITEIEELTTKLHQHSSLTRSNESLRRLLEEKESEEGLHTTVIKNLRRKIELMEQRQEKQITNQHDTKMKMLEITETEKQAIKDSLETDHQKRIAELLATMESEQKTSSETAEKMKNKIESLELSQSRENLQNREQVGLLNKRVVDLAKENDLLIKERTAHNQLVVEKCTIDEENRKLRQEMNNFKKNIIADLQSLKEEADRKSLPTPIRDSKPITDTESTIISPCSSTDSYQVHLMPNDEVNYQNHSLIPFESISLGSSDTLNKDLIEGNYQDTSIELVLLHEGVITPEITAAHSEMMTKLKLCENSSNLTNYFGIVHAPGGLYAVAERKPGMVTLQQYTRRRRRGGNAFSAKEVLIIMTKIVTAISNLHSHQVTHRDLSSFQICISSTPYITSSTLLYVRRFGLTRAPPLLEYTSPESVKTRSFSKQNDIWSIGVVFWEILTYSSCLAFRGTTQKEIEEEILLKTANGESLFNQPKGGSQLWDAVSPCFRVAAERPNAEQLLQELNILKDSSQRVAFSDITLPDPISIGRTGRE